MARRVGDNVACDEAQQVGCPRGWQDCPLVYAGTQAQFARHGSQYSALEWTRAQVAVRNVVAPAHQLEPASRLKSVTRDVNFLRSYLRCR